MIRTIIVMLAALIGFHADAQKFASERGVISFYSHAAIEDITAKNEKATALFDAATGAVAFVVPIRDFQFAKSLMQEHFNEKYMESEKYPKSTFQGKIVGYNAESQGMQQVNARGKLTIHGVTRDVDIPGQMTTGAGGVAMACKFMVELKDYNIDIPRLMWQNIAERVEVTLDFNLKPAGE